MSPLEVAGAVIVEHQPECTHEPYGQIGFLHLVLKLRSAVNAAESEAFYVALYIECGPKAIPIRSFVAVGLARSPLMNCVTPSASLLSLSQKRREWLRTHHADVGALHTKSVSP